MSALSLPFIICMTLYFSPESTKRFSTGLMWRATRAETTSKLMYADLAFSTSTILTFSDHASVRLSSAGTTSLVRHCGPLVSYRQRTLQTGTKQCAVFYKSWTSFASSDVTVWSCSRATAIAPFWLISRSLSAINIY